MSRIKDLAQALLARKAIPNAGTEAVVSGSGRVSPITSPSILSVAIFVAFLYFARPVLLPLALAGLVAFVLSPAVGRLERLRLGRVFSVIIVVLVVFTLTGMIGWLVGSQLVEVIAQLPDYRTNIRHKLSAVTNPKGGTLGKVSKSIGDLNEEISSAQLKTAVPGTGSAKMPTGATAATKPLPVEVVRSSSNEPSLFGTPLFSILGLLTTFGLIVVFTIFMLLQREDLRNRFIRLVSPAELNVMTQALDDATARVGRYLLMQAIVNAIEGVLIAGGLYLIGVPYALLWGSLMTVLRFVAYFGPIVAGIMPVVFTFAAFSGWREALYTAGLLLVIELVVANFIEPWLYGSHTGVSSFAVLASAAFWALLWGPLGLVLATPLTACLVAFGRYIPNLEFFSVLLGDAPVLAPQVRLYQRLLALDYGEAREIATDFLGKHSRLELYELLIFPALSLSEQDRHRGVQNQSQEEFIAESIRELIAEVGDAEVPSAGDFDARRLTVVCVPARDEADEIAATVLKQLVGGRGHRATVVRPAAAEERIRDLVRTDASLVICISAMPPFSMLNARSMATQYRADWPDAQLMVGLWSQTKLAEAEQQRYRTVFDSAVVTSLHDALEHISELSGSPLSGMGQAANS